MNARKITQLGILIAAAFVLGWVERFIPVAPGIPGIKLGLGNTVLLYSVYMMTPKESAMLMVLKVLLSGLLFTGPSGMLYGFAGGAFSLVVMLLSRRIPRMSIITVSVMGAVAHNVGQITVACFMILTRAAIGYLPVLLISGVITGFLTGVAAKYTIKGLKPYHERPKPAASKPDLTDV